VDKAPVTIFPVVGPLTAVEAGVVDGGETVEEVDDTGTDTDTDTDAETEAETGQP
jgi:hypothetical protein